MQIDLYISANSFIFRKGANEVGRVPFSTLELTTSKGASKEDISEMRYFAEEYTPGERYQTKAAGEVVLGPKRDFTHEVTLRAAGNPDMRQYTDIGPKKTVMVCGIDEAKAVVAGYQARYDMGGGNCAKEHGVVWELPKNGKGKRKKVGEVLYNGHFETVAERKAFEEEMKIKYPRTA